MPVKNHRKLRHNPVYFSNRNTEALDEAYKLFMEAFAEYSLQNELTEKQIKNFEHQILSAYLERKASLLLEEKIAGLSGYLEKAISFALNKPVNSEEREQVTKLFYYNNKKHHLVENE